jgi:signal transduction histidine kinase
MNEEEQRRRHQESLAFFGKMGADVSHDMRNVLSIIGEYAGMLDDLLVIAKKPRHLDLQKLKDLSAKMTRQVQKGTQVMERLSNFAHAADEQKKSFDLALLAANIVALSQRQAKLAGCKLEAVLPEEAMPVRTNAFAVQHAIFTAIRAIEESLQKGELVTVRLLAKGASAVVSVSGPAASGGSEQFQERVSRLSEIMNEVNGSAETSWADGTLEVILAIPIE